MDAIRERIAEGQSPTRIARELGVSRGTVYKAKGELLESMTMPVSVNAREQPGKISP